MASPQNSLKLNQTNPYPTQNQNLDWVFRGARQYLENIHQQCIQGCESIKVAVAYADNSKRSFFESCEKSGLMLEYYGRIDHTVPVSPDIMKWFLDRKNPNLQCKLIHKFFHAKVIWWVGAGAYVGSANITDRSGFKTCK